MLLEVKNLRKDFYAPLGLTHTLAHQLIGKMRKRRVSYTVFQDLNLIIKKGECVGIVGTNGCGKSTLLRCISGVMCHTSGEIIQYGKVISLLSHGFGAYEDLPVRYNLLLAQQLFGVTRRQALKNLEEQAYIANVTERIDTPTSQLSEGMRAKVALSALAFVDFDLLLVDEMLNHVDQVWREAFFRFHNAWLDRGRSMIITSHDKSVLDKFATRILNFSELTR